MSRSKPEERSSNPAKRFIEWNGEHGTLQYYDRATKQNIPVAIPMQFIVLDQLASIKGWNDASESGIYSNEVKDTKADVLVVKAFKGGIIAEGFYASIKDKVGAAGGSYTASIYVATKDASGALELNNLQFKGAALNAWIEFRKSAGDAIFKKAVKLTGFGEGKKGKVTFRFPQFSLCDISPATDAAALEVDKALQTYLAGYLGQTKVQQVETDAPSYEEEAGSATDPDPADNETPKARVSVPVMPKDDELDELDDSDIPF
jgi:hypothetical protein